MAQTSEPGGERRFEVIAPKDADMALFLGQVADQGFVVYEKTEAKVEAYDIDRIAAQHWGHNTNAGTFANGILQELRERAERGRILKESDGIAYIALQGTGLNKKTAVIGEQGMTNKELMGRAYERLDNAPTPFNFSIISPTVKAGSVEYKLVPGPVTKAGLGRLVVGRNYVTHQLHEDMGKALDTLVFAAGLEPGSEKDARVHAGRFVEWSNIVSVLESNGFNIGHRKALRDKVNAALYSQIATGQADEHGEVIVKGPTYTEWTHVAIASLSSMANHYRPHAALHSFLQEYRWQ